MRSRCRTSRGRAPPPTITPVYRGQFTWQDEEPQRAWSVFVPRFTNGVEVAINGVVVLDSRRDPAANRPDRNTAAIAVIPSSLLRAGANDLTIRLFVWGPITGFLDRLYVGPRRRPASLLRPAHAAVRHPARGVFGLAGDPGGHSQHHVGDAAP